MRICLVCCASFLLLPQVYASAAEPERDERDAVFNQLDRDKDGVIRADELEESQKQSFQRLLRVGDGDKNGELTRTEYDAALTPTKPGEPPGGRSPFGGRPGFDGERLFRMADQDQNGKLTLDELPGPLKERLQPLFERLGKDELTKEDLRSFRDRLTRKPEPPGEKPAKPADDGGKGKPKRPTAPEVDPVVLDGPPPIFRVLDGDADGQVSRQEFEAFSRKFDELDRNGDGHVDVPEMIELLNARLPGTPSAASQDFSRPRPGDDPDAFLKKHDQDQDGFLSETELPPPMQQRLDRIDRDGDGRISLDELKRSMKRQQKKSPTDAKPE